jgi:hypothetical protein
VRGVVVRGVVRGVVVRGVVRGVVVRVMAVGSSGVRNALARAASHCA